MYSLNYNLRELPGIQSFPPLGFIPKTFRNKIDFFRYNQLPPIKEEEGNSSQSEIELKNISSYSPFSNDDFCNKGFNGNNKGSNTEIRRKKPVQEGSAKSEEPLRSFPPVVNVNCLMNVNMKQQQPLWKTSFGKRLINGKPGIPGTVSLPTMKKVKKSDEKVKENQRSKSADCNRSFVSNRNIQLGNDDKMFQKKKKKIKPVQVQKKPQKVEQKKSKNQKASEISREKQVPETHFMETSVKSVPSCSITLTDSLTSRTSRNQNFLSHCVQSILGGKTTQNNCDYCDEIFSTMEELKSHKEKHEKEKEVCILCNKVFYKSKDFVQHLLTHESVDKFSCKKCKKYFPNLKKYKIHCKEVHLKSLESTKMENNGNLDSLKNCIPKYECKRCHMELDSEEDFRLHKRNHIRLDLMGAYLLSNKSM